MPNAPTYLFSETSVYNLRNASTQLVRGTLFDICQNRIQEAHLLDLFAGSGAIGIEALSREASHATLIENNRTTFHCLKENIATLSLQNQTKRYLGDAFKLLPRLKTPFDISISTRLIK